jgi:hypothetical protein
MTGLDWKSAARRRLSNLEFQGEWELRLNGIVGAFSFVGKESGSKPPPLRGCDSVIARNLGTLLRCFRQARPAGQAGDGSRN